MELFDRIVAGGEKEILALVDNRVTEGLQLDFKLKTDSNNGCFSNEDRKVLAKALSAFSSSAGGIVVWGIDGRKNADGVDCACDVLPISNISRFHSECLSLLAQLLQPKHDRIDVQKIHTEGDSEKGYLIIKVPRSDRRPHRSEAQGQKQYFKRMGDSSIMMEHYDIEDAFRRNTTPELEVCHRLEKTMSVGDGTDHFDLSVQLKNISSITARFPYFYLRALVGGVVRTNYQSKYFYQQEGLWSCYFAGADQVINPETRSTVLRIDAGIKRSKEGLFYIRGALFTQGEVICADYRFGSENSRLTEGLLQITHLDLYGPAQ